ncbi:hypothetical protein, partial [Escherichia coli]
IATRVNIFRERLRNDIPARAKNGQPHHNTTGEAAFLWRDKNCHQTEWTGHIYCSYGTGSSAQ